MKNEPKTISIEEWREIMRVADVKEGWGLEDDTTAEEFSLQVYGAKFRFVSGSPGYQGDLFIIQGDSLEAPMLLIRNEGALQALTDWRSE